MVAVVEGKDGDLVDIKHLIKPLNSYKFGTPESK